VRTSLPAAVLIDLDGTLVDTEPYWFEAEYALVERFGGSWNDAHARALVGNALLTSAAYLREHGGVDLPLPQIVEEMTGHVVRALRHGVPWRPGARELLEALARAGVPCALVTMSYRQLAGTVVAQLPAGTFRAVVTGDEVSRGKPDPQPYELAAQRLGVPAARCIAIEDSPTGIASARAAGARVIAVPHTVPIAPAEGLVIVESLRELDPARLAELSPAAVDGRPG
jgi:HAD superfamily hydrolase (TIGR01509 family)